MPLIQIDLHRSLFEAKGEAISREVHEAQIEALGIPADDKFQVFRPHEPGELVFDPTYGGVNRTDLVIIRITMVHIHSVRAKYALYEAIVRRLGAVGIDHANIQIAVVENGFEDWYAGGLN